MISKIGLIRDKLFFIGFITLMLALIIVKGYTIDKLDKLKRIIK